MANLSGLAKDSAVYGLTAILGRSINYLLIPIHTYAIPAASGQYSIVTRLYAATAILMLVLTFGMETTMFRFLNKEDGDKQKTYSTILTFVGMLTVAFITIMVVFPNEISTLVGYPETPYYVAALFITVSLDAFQAIPLAYLRYKKRPIKFMMVYVGKIAFIVILNFLYFIALPYLHINPFGLYDQSFTLDIGYTFYINLLGSIASTLFLVKEICIAKPMIDHAIFSKLFAYSWPLVLLNVAGQVNKSADKLIYPLLDKTPESAVNLSVYGGVVKIAAIMTMITQAFRYAYEPRVFAIVKDKESKEYQAQTMKYYLIFMLLAFLTVVAFMNILRRIIAPDYWSGLYIVPITMATEIFIGIYYNLSMWYKLIDQTRWGACFSIVACIIYFAVNIIFVPRFGYVACACAGLVAYIVAVLLSYFIGQVKNPIKYPLLDIASYSAIAALFFAIMTWSNYHLSYWAALGANSVVLALFVAHIIHYDLPLSELPYIGKYFKKKG